MSNALGLERTVSADDLIKLGIPLEAVEHLRERVFDVLNLRTMPLRQLFMLGNKYKAEFKYLLTLYNFVGPVSETLYLPHSYKNRGVIVWPGPIRAEGYVKANILVCRDILIESYPVPYTEVVVQGTLECFEWLAVDRTIAASYVYTAPDTQCAELLASLFVGYDPARTPAHPHILSASGALTAHEVSFYGGDIHVGEVSVNSLTASSVKCNGSVLVKQQLEVEKSVHALGHINMYGFTSAEALFAGDNVHLGNLTHVERIAAGLNGGPNDTVYSPTDVSSSIICGQFKSILPRYG